MAGVGWGDLLGGVLAGLIASAIAWGVSRASRWKRDREDFGRLAGKYRVSEKQRSERADGTVTLTGNGPVLDFAWTPEDGSDVRGTLSMNEQSRMTGAGSYEHIRGANRGWGDFTVLASDLLVAWIRERDPPWISGRSEANAPGVDFGEGQLGDRVPRASGTEEPHEAPGTNDDLITRRVAISTEH